MPGKIFTTIIILTIAIWGCKNKSAEGTLTGTAGKASTENMKVPETANATEPESGIQQNAVQRPAIPIEQILEAALNGNLPVIKEAVDNNFDVNSTDREMHTALMMAAYNGHSEIVQLLLKEGAIPDQKDVMNRTALMYASTGPFNESVSLLLDAGADPNLVDGEEHFTALMFAAAEGQTEVVKNLLKHGADKDMVDVDGETAMDFAMHNGHTEIVNLLK